MITSVQSLIEVGCCVSLLRWILRVIRDVDLRVQREMPVFGIIHDHVVLGVIVKNPLNFFYSSVSFLGRTSYAEFLWLQLFRRI